MFVIAVLKCSVPACNCKITFDDSGDRDCGDDGGGGGDDGGGGGGGEVGDHDGGGGDGSC